MSNNDKNIFSKDYVKNELVSNPFSSMSNIAYKAIEEAILSARLKPGDKLTVLNIAEQLGLSTTPVLEAIYLLEEKGLVKCELKEGGRHRTYRVRGISRDEIEEIYLARRAIENTAARWCAEHPWHVDLKKLEELAFNYLNFWKEFSVSGTVIAPVDLAEYDRELHRLIVSSTKNKYLIDAYDAIDERLTYMSAIVGTEVFDEATEDMLSLGHQHVAIYNAIKLGLTDVAASLMNEHLDFCIDLPKKYFRNI